MQLIDRFLDADRDRCMRLLAVASRIRTHQGLFNWLRSADLQHVLPHDVMLALWGDVGSGRFDFDVVSAMPGVRTSTVDPEKLLPCGQQLLARWVEQLEQPCAVDGRVLDRIFASPALAGRAALVHGLHDLRTGQDCLYVVVSQPQGHADSARDALMTLLPHIDLGFRQVAALPRRSARAVVSAYHERPAAMPRMLAEQITVPATPAPLNTTAMTERELQIMRWVEMGKTNHEIGAILDISAFTVKNHLQRIFKKLDVYSRAQAVSRFKDSMLHG